MRRFRFTIASLLGLVLFVGLGFAALREQTDLWDSVLFGACLLTLLVAALLTVHHAHERRSYWLGFTLFGWTYFVGSMIPHVEARLSTTRLFNLVNERTMGMGPPEFAIIDSNYDGSTDILVARGPTTFVNTGNGKFTATTSNPAAISGGMLALTGKSLNQSSAMWMSSTSAPVSNENLIRISHSLATLVIAFGGGYLSYWLFLRARRDRTGEPLPRQDHI